MDGQGYTGDVQSGLTLFGMRYYNPQSGRWLTRDPIGYAGGMNLYAYCDGDPVNNSDPSGLDCGWADGFTRDHFNRPVAPPGPKTVNLAKNAARVARYGWNLWWFRGQVQTGGPWDFKSEGPKRVYVHPEYEDFGNYHYGYVGASMYSLELLLAEAGRAQRKDNTTRWPGDPGKIGLPWTGTSPYGDDPRDQYWIKRGYEDYFVESIMTGFTRDIDANRVTPN